MKRGILLTLLIGSLAACTQTPTQRTLSICSSCLKLPINHSHKHPIQSFGKNMSATSSVLHIYLEGDGLAWTSKGVPSTNPSSHTLTALKLMALDSNPSLYLNRPCYGYEVMPKNCSMDLWTMGRYSEEIVNGMNASINDALEGSRFEKLVLIGHSGGGTLAMLVAKRRKDIAGVVTLGANLDHKAWTDFFNYLPLSNSLNPTEGHILSPDVFRWHFAGGKDTQVPASITKNAADKDSFSKYIFNKEYNHNCCWHQIWPDVLADIDLRLKVRRPPASGK